MDSIHTSCYCTTYITPLIHPGAAAILASQESQNGQMAIGSCIPQCTLPILHTYAPHRIRMYMFVCVGGGGGGDTQCM